VRSPWRSPDGLVCGERWGHGGYAKRVAGWIKKNAPPRIGLRIDWLRAKGDGLLLRLVEVFAGR
jgi:hypothetical protein